MTLVDLRDFMPMNNCDWTNEHRDWRPWTSLNNDASKFDMVKIGRIVVYLNLLLEGRIHWLNSFFVCHGIQAWQCFLMSSFIRCIQSTCDGFHCINQTGSLLPLHRLPKNRWCFPYVFQKIVLFQAAKARFFVLSSWFSSQNFTWEQVTWGEASLGGACEGIQEMRDVKEIQVRDRCGWDLWVTIRLLFFFVKIKTKNMWTKSGVFWGAYFKT